MPNNTTKFWDALAQANYPKAIQHLSPGMYRVYLQAGQISQEQGEQIEAAMRLWLTIYIAQAADDPNQIDLAVRDLEKWFGFGDFRDVPSDLSPARAQVEAELDAQRVAVVRAILEEPRLAMSDKVAAALRASSIQPGSMMGWGECQALAQVLSPLGLDCQDALEAWCNRMYRWIKQSVLGVTRG